MSHYIELYHITYHTMAYTLYYIVLYCSASYYIILQHISCHISYHTIYHIRKSVIRNYWLKWFISDREDYANCLWKDRSINQNDNRVVIIHSHALKIHRWRLISCKVQRSPWRPRWSMLRRRRRTQTLPAKLGVKSVRTFPYKLVSAKICAAQQCITNYKLVF